MGLRNRIRVLAALMVAPAVPWALAGCRDLPPHQQPEVPRLQLGQATRPLALRAYGVPRMKTATELWYVGPGVRSLQDGADGWMHLMTFDHEGVLIRRELVRRGSEQGYVRVDCSAHGWLNDHDRDKDFDKLMLARCRDLARENPQYQVTTDSPGLFVLIRRLPSENEPVAQWQFKDNEDRSLASLWVTALPGRDEPLMDKITDAVTTRMQLIVTHGQLEEEP